MRDRAPSHYVLARRRGTARPISTFAGSREVDMHVVLVTRVGDDDSHRPGGVRSSSRRRSSALRRRRTGRGDPARAGDRTGGARPAGAGSVEPRVVDVDVESVLVGDVLVGHRAAALAADVADDDARCPRIRGPVAIDHRDDRTDRVLVAVKPVGGIGTLSPTGFQVTQLGPSSGSWVPSSQAARPRQADRGSVMPFDRRERAPACSAPLWPCRGTRAARDASDPRLRSLRLDDGERAERYPQVAAPRSQVDWPDCVLGRRGAKPQRQAGRILREELAP